MREDFLTDYRINGRKTLKKAEHSVRHLRDYFGGYGSHKSPHRKFKLTLNKDQGGRVMNVKKYSLPAKSKAPKPLCVLIAVQMSWQKARPTPRSTASWQHSSACSTWEQNRLNLKLTACPIFLCSRKTTSARASLNTGTSWP